MKYHRSDGFTNRGQKGDGTAGVSSVILVRLLSVDPPPSASYRAAAWPSVFIVAARGAVFFFCFDPGRFFAVARFIRRVARKL